VSTYRPTADDTNETKLQTTLPYITNGNHVLYWRQLVKDFPKVIVAVVFYKM